MARWCLVTCVFVRYAIGLVDMRAAFDGTDRSLHLYHH
jgi:hypothetical protein